MSNQSSNLDLLTSGQASKEVTTNDLFDAGSTSTTFGRRATATAGLTWGYYGGTVSVSGVLQQVPNGTVTLSNNATNYLEWDPSASPTGVIKNTSGWTGGSVIPLYKVTTSGGNVTNYEDWRTASGSGAPAGAVTASAVSITDAGGYFSSPDVEGALQEIGVQLAKADADTDVKFTSDTGSTADSDPGNGKFKWNNATQSSATALYVDNQTSDGVSLTTFFAALGTTGFIQLAQDDDTTKWQLWKWSAAPTAGSGYYKFTSLTLMASSGSIGNGKTVSLAFRDKAGGSITAAGLTMSSGKILARTTAGTGAPEEKTLSQLLDMIGSAADGDILYRASGAWTRLPMGTQFQKLQQGASAPAWVDDAVVFGIFCGGKPTANEMLFKHSFREQLKLVASLTGSKFSCETNPAATWTFTLNKNGSSIGTIAFSTGGVPTITFASDVTFAVDDTLSITAPGTADSTGSDLMFALKFARA
jgi:hypothetical protein